MPACQGTQTTICLFLKQTSDERSHRWPCHQVDSVGKRSRVKAKSWAGVTRGKPSTSAFFRNWQEGFRVRIFGGVQQWGVLLKSPWDTWFVVLPRLGIIKAGSISVCKLMYGFANLSARIFLGFALQLGNIQTTTRLYFSLLHYQKGGSQFKKKKIIRAYKVHLTTSLLRWKCHLSCHSQRVVNLSADVSLFVVFLFVLYSACAVWCIKKLKLKLVNVHSLLENHFEADMQRPYPTCCLSVRNFDSARLSEFFHI